MTKNINISWLESEFQDKTFMRVRIMRMRRRHYA